MSADERASQDGSTEEKSQISFRDWKKLKEREEQSKSNKAPTTTSRKKDRNQMNPTNNNNNNNHNYSERGNNRNNRYMNNVDNSNNFGCNNYNGGDGSIFNAGRCYNPQSLFNSNYTNFCMPQPNFNNPFAMQPLISAMQQNQMNAPNMYGGRQNFSNSERRNNNYQRNNFKTNDFNSKPDGFRKGKRQNKKTADENKSKTQAPIEKKPEDEQISNTNKSTVELSTKPQIYVARYPSTPKYTNGPKRANWIQKPDRPPPINAITPESKEEKQRLWREYRQALKPLKNRDFHNAKRTIQRLGKRNPSELDEKEQFRLQRAQEFVAAHKAKISQKAAVRWVQVQDAHSNPTEANFFQPAQPPRPAQQGQSRQIVPAAAAPYATTTQTTRNTTAPNKESDANTSWDQFYGKEENLFQHWSTYNMNQKVANQPYTSNFVSGGFFNNAPMNNSMGSFAN